MNTRHAWKLPVVVSVAEMREAWEYFANVNGKNYQHSYGDSLGEMTMAMACRMVSDAHYDAEVRRRRAARKAK